MSVLSLPLSCARTTHQMCNFGALWQGTRQGRDCLKSDCKAYCVLTTCYWLVYAHGSNPGELRAYVRAKHTWILLSFMLAPVEQDVGG